MNTTLQKYECGYGWEKLIHKAERIVDLYNYFHPELEFPLDFSQIKEKWGGLCLYLNQYIPEVSEKIHKLENKSYLIGTDEAGRGPAAGGVWAAAVCFKQGIDVNLFQKLNDSKKLTPTLSLSE